MRRLTLLLTLLAVAAALALPSAASARFCGNVSIFHVESRWGSTCGLARYTAGILARTTNVPRYIHVSFNDGTRYILSREFLHRHPASVDYIGTIDTYGDVDVYLWIRNVDARRRSRSHAHNGPAPPTPHKRQPSASVSRRARPCGSAWRTLRQRACRERSRNGMRWWDQEISAATPGLESIERTPAPQVP